MAAFEPRVLCKNKGSVMDVLPRAVNLGQEVFARVEIEGDTSWRRGNFFETNSVDSRCVFALEVKRGGARCFVRQGRHFAQVGGKFEQLRLRPPDGVAVGPELPPCRLEGLRCGRG